MKFCGSNSLIINAGLMLFSPELSLQSDFQMNSNQHYYSSMYVSFRYECQRFQTRYHVDYGFLGFGSMRTVLRLARTAAIMCDHLLNPTATGSAKT